MLLLMLTAVHRSHAQTPFFSEVTYWQMQMPASHGSGDAIAFSLTEESWGGGVRAQFVGLGSSPVDVRNGDDFLRDGRRIGQQITGKWVVGNGRSRAPCPPTFDACLCA